MVNPNSLTSFARSLKINHAHKKMKNKTIRILTFPAGIMTKPKRSQMKIQQTAFMLIFLTILFVMIGILFISFYMNSLKQNVNILNENKAIILSQYLYQSSEFSCVGSGLYCIDSDRLLFFNETKYKNLFPVTYIKITKVYPIEPEKKCTLTNYPNCNTFEFSFKEHNQTCKSSFVALCRQESNEQGPYKVCDLARFCVGYDIK